MCRLLPRNRPKASEKHNLPKIITYPERILTTNWTKEQFFQIWPNFSCFYDLFFVVSDRNEKHLFYDIGTTVVRLHSVLHSLLSLFVIVTVIDLVLGWPDGWKVGQKWNFWKVTVIFGGFWRFYRFFCMTLRPKVVIWQKTTKTLPKPGGPVILALFCPFWPLSHRIPATKQPYFIWSLCNIFRLCLLICSLVVVFSTYEVRTIVTHKKYPSLHHQWQF